MNGFSEVSAFAICKDRNSTVSSRKNSREPPRCFDLYRDLLCAYNEKLSCVAVSAEEKGIESSYSNNTEQQWVFKFWNPMAAHSVEKIRTELLSGDAEGN